MKVIFDSDGILIRPETDFEETWLKEQYKEEKNTGTIARLKNGLSAADFVGLKINRVGGFAQP